MAQARRFHLRRGRVLDPKTKVDTEQDLILGDGKIERIGKGLATPAGAEVIDAAGMLVTPGLIDIHTHVREPGEEYKETIATASAAAVAGGFTALCTMPNTNPTNDQRVVTELIKQRGAEVGLVHIYPVGAVSKGLKGETLAEIGELVECGVVALSDDGRPIMNARLMRRALEYGRTFGIPIIQHAEDLDLSAGGVMNEGIASNRAGLRGQPVAAEEVIIARDLALVELTGARYHVAHISSAGSIAMVRDAKRRGLPVTCEVTPHHLTLTDEACLSYDTATKCNPPLRTSSDVEALRQALADGTIDAVATDHAPHTSLEKQCEFDQAAFGMIGLETALALVLRLVRDGYLTLATAIERMTWGPARTLNLPGGTLAEGGPADIVCIDLERRWVVEAEHGRSKSKNTPFAGQAMTGRAVLTLRGGAIMFDERAG